MKVKLNGTIRIDKVVVDFRSNNVSIDGFIIIDNKGVTGAEISINNEHSFASIEFLNALEKVLNEYVYVETQK